MSQDKDKPALPFGPISISLGGLRPAPAPVAGPGAEALLRAGMTALDSGRPGEAEKAFEAAARIAGPGSAAWAPEGSQRRSSDRAMCALAISGARAIAAS